VLIQFGSTLVHPILR